MNRYKYEKYIPSKPIYNGNDYVGMIPGYTESNIRNRKQIYSGNLVKDDNGKIVELSRLTSFGDYDNSCMVEKSNYESVKKYLKENKIRYFDVYGGYGFNGLYVRIQDYESNEIILDVIESLDDYPLFDDDHYSNMAFDSYCEQWESDGMQDFIYALKKEFNLSDTVSDRMESIDSDLLMTFFENLLPSGEWYYDEDPNGVYILVDYAAKNCKRNELAAFLYNKEYRVSLPIKSAAARASKLQMRFDNL